MRINDILVEFAPAGGGDSGNYFQALASAWYNGTFDTGSLQKGIKSQQDVERLLNRGIVCPDGKTRKLHIDYNANFDGVEIYSDDYYEYGDHDDTIDSRTGQKWGPYDFMAFSDEDLSEGLAEGLAQDEAEETSGWRAEFVNEINYNTFEVRLTNARSKESANFIIRPVDMVSYGPTLSIETMDVRDLQTGQTESWTNDDPAPEGPIAYAISGLFYDDKQLQKKLRNIIDTHNTKGQDTLPGLEKRRSIGQEVDADAYVDAGEKTQAAMAKMKQGVAEDWQKANKRDRTDGMSQKAVNAYRREHPGSKLKTAVTTKPSKLKKGSKASKRRKSYCSRSRGQMKMHNISCAKTPDKAICKARRRWNC
jgi:hypothetical protein